MNKFKHHLFSDKMIKVSKIWQFDKLEVVLLRSVFGKFDRITWFLGPFINDVTQTWPKIDIPSPSIPQKSLVYLEIVEMTFWEPKRWETGLNFEKQANIHSQVLV